MKPETLSAGAVLAGGLIALLVATSGWGAAISNDSIDYLQGAASLLKDGVYAAPAAEYPHSIRPITHWPPVFSLAIAMTAKLLGTAPVRAD